MTRPDATDYFAKDPYTIYRRIRLTLKRVDALRWMWVNNIKERKHELLRRS